MSKQNCKNCGSSNVNQYCQECGQKVIAGFQWRDVYRPFQDLLGLRKGFFLNFITLIRRPGQTVKEYLRGKTKIYQAPVSYYFTTLFFAILITIADNQFDPEYDAEGLSDRLSSFLITLPYLIIVALLQRLFFYKHGWKLLEHFIFSFYYIGTALMVAAILTMVKVLLMYSKLIHYPSNFDIFNIMFCYFSFLWIFNFRFFKEHWFWTTIKTLIVFIFGAAAVGAFAFLLEG